MILVAFIVIPFIVVVTLYEANIKDLKRALYEKEQENKTLRLQIGAPFRSDGDDHED